MRHHTLGFSLFIGSLAIVRPVSAQPGMTPQRSQLDTILTVAEEYVARFSAESSLLVTREHYTQDLYSRGFFDIGGRVVEELRVKRVLDSEIVLIKNPDPADNRYPFLEFRDVVSVDTRPITGRADRIAQLFLNPEKRTSLSRIREIADASAAYNLGAFQRNLNLPTMALLFLAAENRSRSDCRLLGPQDRMGNDPFQVACAEHQRPTLIARAYSGLNLPAETKFWIRRDGTILRTHLHLGDGPRWSADIWVDYGASPLAAVWLPTRMREDYLDGSSRERVQGLAEYRETKRFTTSGRVVPK